MGATMRRPIVEAPFEADPAGLLPVVTPDNAPFWRALEDGRLCLQCCPRCSRVRYPIVPVCPYCLCSAVAWKEVNGRGRIFSWIRYRRSYLAEFEHLMPYIVLTVELDEGPRIFGRLIEREIEPALGQPVSLIIERWPNRRCVPAFSLTNFRGRD